MAHMRRFRANGSLVRTATGLAEDPEPKKNTKCGCPATAWPLSTIRWLTPTRSSGLTLSTSALAVAMLVQRVSMAKEPSQRLVLVRQLVEPVEVAAEPLLDHADHQGPPHLHARAPDLAVGVGKNVLLHEREQPFAEVFVAIEMLEPDKQDGNFVPGLEVQLNVLDPRRVPVAD